MVCAVPIGERQKPRYDRELQSHRDILSLFDKPLTISIDDIALAAGYCRTVTILRLKEIAGMGKLKITKHPHEWAKPNTYERTP